MLELAGTLPAEYLVSDTGETRSILRYALRGLVPDATLDRPHPLGFPVPLVPWLHELRPWVEACFRELEVLPIFQGPSASTIWEHVQSVDSAEAAYRIWRWISLLEWTKAHSIRFE
jgi:asparagine synthase (glutamine-hydrolysing)